MIFVVDQAHKWWMLLVYRIAERGRVTVTPFLDLVFVKNTGISYSLLDQSSYSWQLAESSDGRWLGNSPRHMAKISLHQPLFSTNWQAGLEMQYFGPRRNQGGTIVGGYTLANLNLLNRRIARDLEFSLRVSNLFDKSYADPAAIDFAPLDRVTQDGREWVARLESQF